MNKQKKIIIWIMVAIIMLSTIASTNFTHAKTTTILEDLTIQDNNIENGGECRLQFTWIGEPFETIDFHFTCDGRPKGIVIRVEQSDLQADGTVDCPYCVANHIVSGTYELSQIYVKYLDWTSDTYKMNNSDVLIHVDNDAQDIEAPELIMDSIVVTQEGRFVTIEFNAKDEGSGLHSASFNFMRSDDTTLTVWGNTATEVDAQDYVLIKTDHGYAIRNNVHLYSEGSYELFEVLLEDNNGNKETYAISDDSSLKILSKDTRIPGIDAIEVHTISSLEGTELNITGDWTPGTVEQLVLCFTSDTSPSHKVWVSIGEEDIGSGQFNKSVWLNTYLPTGKYVLSQISVRDSGFVSCKGDLSGIDEIVHGVNDLYKGEVYGSPFFEITHEPEDTVPPQIHGIESISIEKDTFTLIFEASDNPSGIRDVLLTLGSDLYIYGALGNELTVLEDNPDKPDNLNKRYRLTRKLPAGMPAGIFRVLSLRIRDESFNEKVYPFGDLLLKDTSFTLERGVPYTVTFLDWDGNVLKVEEVACHEGGTPPLDPARAGYAFTGWDPDYSCVTSDLTITAQYEELESSPPVTGSDESSPVAADSPVFRIAGDDRYGTAVELSRGAYDASSTVVLASGENFPDALAGSVLASCCDAPLLLVRDRRVVLDLVLEEIKRLGASEVIILGGVLAVSAEVENEIGAVVPTVRRVAGSNRYETAHLIAKETGVPEEGHVFLASGASYPDALSMGPVAAREGIPILLTHPDRLLPELEVALDDLGVRRITLIGGPRAISSEVEAVLEQRFVLSRVQGDVREDTALEIAKLYFNDPHEFLVASGDNFPDGLVGGYYAALHDWPLLLVRDRGVRASVGAYLGTQGADRLILLGGPVAITEVIEGALLGFCR